MSPRPTEITGRLEAQFYSRQKAFCLWKVQDAAYIDARFFVGSCLRQRLSILALGSSFCDTKMSSLQKRLGVLASPPEKKYLLPAVFPPRANKQIDARPRGGNRQTANRFYSFTACVLNFLKPFNC
jgi:hypothetical protein